MGIKEILEKALPDIARRFRNELVLKCPVDTGRLRASIKVKVEGNSLIIWMVNYGKYIEFGSPPHVIKPKDKKALKFKSGNDVVFSKEVRHPGSRPNPFIRTAINTKLKEIIIQEINNNI